MGVASEIAVALAFTVMEGRAIDLDDEHVADDEVDAPHRDDFHLRSHGQAPVPQAPPHERFEPAIGIRPRKAERLAPVRIRVVVQPSAVRAAQKSQSQRGFERDEELLDSAAPQDLPEDVGDREGREGPLEGMSLQWRMHEQPSCR